MTAMISPPACWAIGTGLTLALFVVLLCCRRGKVKRGVPDEMEGEPDA